MGLVGCAEMEQFGVRAIVGPMASGVSSLPGAPLAVRARDGVWLRGFVERSATPAKGTILLFHGVGANSAFWSDEARALANSGYDAVAWDARGHGRSEGFCSYGARERDDIGEVLDALAVHRLTHPVVLYGYSMGAAVAIQGAVKDARIDGVLAIAPFATLDAVIRQVIWAAPRKLIDHVIAAAERRARFTVATIRPLDDAAHLAVPVIIVVGALDERIPLDDERAIARAASATLVIVPGANHEDILERCGAACDNALAALLRDGSRRFHVQRN